MTMIKIQTWQCNGAKTENSPQWGLAKIETNLQVQNSINPQS